ncbi:MAG TPA: hypothetical protein DDX40_05310 [Rikenellaceae bacterium]|nr:hypothetical protein [Rikenellaceae bacterium]
MDILVRKILAFALIALATVSQAFAQGSAEKRDSVIYRQSAAMDSTLVGKNIFNLLSGYGENDSKVTVHQSQRILNAFESHLAANPSRTSTGFRVRIFNDNKQTSRNDSEAALARFKGMFPGVSAYRTYFNPFFRVTVGDFRTKSEAMQLLQQVKGSFPTAFIVKETIGYPVVDRFHSYTVETVNQE